jgi:hypothetical protein
MKAGETPAMRPRAHIKANTARMRKVFVGYVGWDIKTTKDMIIKLSSERRT